MNAKLFKFRKELKLMESMDPKAQIQSEIPYLGKDEEENKSKKQKKCNNLVFSYSSKITLI